MMVQRYHQVRSPTTKTIVSFLNRTAGTGDAVLPGLHVFPEVASCQAYRIFRQTVHDASSA